MSGESYVLLCSNLTYLISNFHFFLPFIDFTRVCQIIGVALYTKECQLLSNSNPFALLAQFFTSVLHFSSPLFVFVHKPVFKIITNFSLPLTTFPLLKSEYQSQSREIFHAAQIAFCAAKRLFPYTVEDFSRCSEREFITRLCGWGMTIERQKKNYP